MTSDDFEHALSISNKKIFLHYFHKDISDVFKNGFISAIIFFFLWALVGLSELIEEQTNDLQFECNSIWRGVGVASEVEIEVKKQSIDHCLTIAMFGKQEKRFLGLIDQINHLLVSIIPQDEVELREVAAK